MDLNVSIVLYKTDEQEFRKALNSLMLGARHIAKIYIIDNSPDQILEPIARSYGDIVEYLHSGNNLGYGKAHNIALRKSVEQGVAYHLVMNPDVYFQEDIFEELLLFMEQNSDVGQLMPKVLNHDGSLQHLCKLLPTPKELFARRFLPVAAMKEKINWNYEMRFADYTQVFDAPSLSGCFMLLRTRCLQTAGFFDEKYFMYLEDIDLTRRVGQVSRTVFYPAVKVYHGYAKGSYRKLNLLWHHIRSAVYYFNKWGWFSNWRHYRVNRKALRKHSRK